MPVTMEQMFAEPNFGVEQSDSQVLGSPCEDIWKKFDDFLLTPPQSPPVKYGDLGCGPLEDLSICSALDGFLEASITDSALAEVLNSFAPPDVDVLHDCMWSGQEDAFFGAPAITTARPATGRARPETPLLSTSPLGLSGFGEMLATCPEMDVTATIVEEDEGMQDDEASASSQTSSVASDSASSGFVSSNSDSLINDHSYGSPKSSPRPKQMQSLIYPSPSYRKVLSRTRNSMKSRKQQKLVEKEVSVLAPQVTVKFVKRSPCHAVAKEGSSLHGKKPVSKPCKSAPTTKKSLGSYFSKHSASSSSTFSTSSFSAVAGHSVVSAAPASPLVVSTSSQSSSASSSSSCSSSSGKSPCSSPFASSKSSRMSSSFKNHAKATKSMYPERRREHNDSERKRRDHLRNAFHALRDQVPKLKETQKKPARITILHEASSYVGHLLDKHRYLEKTKDAESKKRERLLKKLAILQNACATLNELHLAKKKKRNMKASIDWRS